MHYQIVGAATKIAITGIRLTVMAGHCPGHQS